ncbi:MAG: hypothetical protein WCK60_01575 [Candidatus Nomurabacteria bacterium]
MRKLLSKSPEFTSQPFSLENASAHPGKLSDHLEGFKLAGDVIRSTTEDLSLKIVCDMTDRMVLRTAAKRV